MTSSNDNKVSPTTSDGSQKNGATEKKNDVGASQQNDASSSNQQINHLDDAKARQQETLARMTEMVQKLGVNNDNQIHQLQQSTTTNDQGKQQQNTLTPSNTQQVHNNQQNAPSNTQQVHNNQQNVQVHPKTPTLPGPPPTSMNVGMSPAASNQINTQYFQMQHPWVRN
jgi:hypothetical protein